MSYKVKFFEPCGHVYEVINPKSKYYKSWVQLWRIDEDLKPSYDCKVVYDSIKHKFYLMEDEQKAFCSFNKDELEIVFNRDDFQFFIHTTYNQERKKVA